MRDFMRDCLKNGCGFDVYAEVVKVNFCRPDVHVAEYLLRTPGVFEVCRQIVPQAVSGEKRHFGSRAHPLEKVLDIPALPVVTGARPGVGENVNLSASPFFINGIQHIVQRLADGNKPWLPVASVALGRPEPQAFALKVYVFPSKFAKLGNAPCSVE
jgi:hypothetical protein